MVEHEILTIEEVAKYVRVSERTIYDWANEGEIPCGKLGTSWRFKRSEIERWVDERLGASKKRQEPRPLSFNHLIIPERVLILDCSTKVDILNQMIANLATAPEVKDGEQLAEAVFRREDLMSTGIGKHVAVPHVRLAMVTDLALTVALNRQDITDYESLDGLPVRLLFMIAARQDQHAQHVKTLSAIGHLVRDEAQLDRILHAANVETLCNVLRGKDA